jgi:hypothetical protein
LTLDDAREKLERWRRDYNEARNIRERTMESGPYPKSSGIFGEQISQIGQWPDAVINAAKPTTPARV